MRWIVAAALCAALGAAPSPGGARAQDLQETLGRLLQGFQGQQGQQGDPRQDPRHDPRDGDRRGGAAYSDRWEPQDRLRALDEAERRLDAQQRRLDEDRRRIEAERRRLMR
jgi:hypothetical protein